MKHTHTHTHTKTNKQTNKTTTTPNQTQKHTDTHTTHTHTLLSTNHKERSTFNLLRRLSVSPAFYSNGNETEYDNCVYYISIHLDLFFSSVLFVFNTKV